MGLLDRLMASALVRRMEQEGRAMQQGTLGGTPEPGQGPGLRLGPMAGPAVAIPHAIGLVGEGGGRVANTVTGEGLYALANIIRASRAASGPDIPTTPMSQLAEQVAAEGPGHPGRIVDLVRHSPDPVVSRATGAFELGPANPLNYAEGPAALARMPEVAALAPRAVPLLEGASRAMNVVNDAPFAPLALLNAARQGRALMAAQEASTAAAPALRQEAARLAANEHLAQVVAEKFTGARPPAQSLASRYARNLIDAAPPVSPAVPRPDLPPTVVRPAPQTMVPRVVRPAPQEQVPRIVRPAPQTGIPPLPPETYTREPTFAFGPASVLQDAAQRLGVTTPAAQTAEDLRTAFQALPSPTTPTTPAGQLPLPSEALSAPTGVFGDRTGIIRQVANAPLTHLNSVLADLHNSLYPGQRADFAIPALTGQPKAAFRTSFLTDHPEGNAAEPYLDYLLNRVQKDSKAAARLATLNPTLADDVARLAQTDLPLGEHKALIQSLFKGVGETATGAADVSSAAAKEPSAQAAAGTLDDFTALVASRDNGKMGAYLPGADFFVKRLGVSVEQARAWIQGLVDSGTVGRLPDGELAFRPQPPGGDIAAGGGGAGLGLLPPRLLQTAAGGLAGAGVGAGIGAAVDTEDRARGARKGAAIGALAGGNLGAVSPELAQLPAVAGSMVSPAMQARGARAFQRGMQAARETGGARGVGGLAKATAAQWRAQAVNTLKQLPQDALTRWSTMWGIARREFGVDDAAIRDWQERLATSRDTGVTALNNPVVSKLRRLGLQRLLPDDTFRDVYGTDFVTSEGASSAKAGRLTPGGQAGVGALLSGATPLPRVNPISVGLGAAKSYWQPGIDAYVQFLNGVQHDAFRYAMADKALDRDIPAIAKAYLDDLTAQGFNVAPLAAKGSYFSGAEVAKVAGKDAGKQWDDLLEAVVRQHGDRIAKLAGDFREASALPGEAALGRIAPFMRWPLHYAPVVAEMAEKNPRLAVVLAGIMADQQERGKEAGLAAYERMTVPVTTETPVLGALARARLGGQAGTVRVNPIGAVLPFSGMAGGADTSAITDPEATAYQRLTAAGDLVGAGPNPLIQSAAYALGQDYQPPQALSRTAGLEGLARLLPGPLGRLSMPSGGALLNTVRGVVEPTLHNAGVPTAGPTTENDPVFRRYAELVLDATDLPLSDPANRHYLTIDSPEAEALYQVAKRQALVAASVGNAVSLTSPVSQTARGADAAAILAARRGIPYTAEQVAGSSPAVAALMQQRLRDYQAATPELAAYKGASVPDRERILTQMHGILKPGTPAYRMVLDALKQGAAWQER